MSGIWDEILDGVASRQKSLSRKNLIVLGEPRTGKSTLLSQLLKTSSGGSSSLVKPIALPGAVSKVSSSRLDLAAGYEWVDVRDEGDEETLPPLSIYTPPSSHPSLLRLLPLSLQADPSPSSTASSSTVPPAATTSSILADTAIVIVLDWTKPGKMIDELLSWLEWVDEWAASVAGKADGDENRERLQAHLQHYVEPPLPAQSPSPAIGGPSSEKGPDNISSSTTLSSLYPLGITEVLPLGPGTLTRNPYGVPITIVCSKSDQIDVIAEELGFGGGPGSGGGKSGGGKGAWEERTDWIGQVLRLVALMHGAALFYTSQSHPSTVANLRAYLLHRLYTPAPLPSSSTAPPPPLTSTRFPFSVRANILDRDQVLVPAGWDTWNKIDVLRDGFEPDRVTEAWGISLKRRRAEKSGTAPEVEEEVEDMEDLWDGVIPEMGDDPVNDSSARLVTAELDQSFLSKNYDVIQKEATLRTGQPSFRAATSLPPSSSGLNDSSSRLVGVVGPMGSGGLSLPGVEKVMAELSGGSFSNGAKKDGRPTLARDHSSALSSIQGPASPLILDSSSIASPPLSAGLPGSGQPPHSTEALHNFFQSLLTTRKNTGVATLAGSAAGSSTPGARSPSPTKTEH